MPKKSKKSKKVAPDCAFEISLMEGIHRRDPDDPQTLGVLAALYTEAGMIEKGLELDLHHVEVAPGDPSAHYDLACSLSLYDHLDEAFGELKIALALGFENTDWMLKDPDLEAVRKDPRWAELMAEPRLPTADEE